MLTFIIPNQLRHVFFLFPLQRNCQQFLRAPLTADLQPFDQRSHYTLKHTTVFHDTHVSLADWK